jgi:hypothetical protein
MAADASAYAVLGLRPGADWSSVERAYKSLIKTHHPDRAGGDAVRAAEINRAYRELRQARTEPDDAAEPWIAPDEVEAKPRSSRWIGAAFGLAAGAVLLVVVTTPVGGLVADFRNRATPLGALVHPRAAAPSDPVAGPLDGHAVQAAIMDALKVVGTGNEDAMAEASRACHARLHLQPSLSRLDQCAAFDDAIVALQNRDPLHDDGPFGQVAVTGREMSGGGLFSDDYLAIDARLGRIRRAVEQTLGPPGPQVAPPLNSAG